MKQHLRRLLCLSLSLLICMLASCSIYSDRKVANRTYMETRKQILTSPRPAGSEAYTVYAAVIDIDSGDHVRSLACFTDGTTSLYLSTGEAYENLHTEAPELATATQDFLKGMSERIDLATWQAKTDLALPEPGKDLLYLLTDQGIHTLTVIPSYIPESTEDAQEIYRLYRAVYEAAVTNSAVPATSADT